MGSECVGDGEEGSSRCTCILPYHNQVHTFKN